MIRNINSTKPITLVHAVKNFGLFSELTAIVHSYYYAVRHGMNFTIHDNSSLYGGRLNYLSDFFEPFQQMDSPDQTFVDVDEPMNKQIRIFCRQNFFDDERQILYRVLRLKREVQAEVERLIQSWKLPPRYNCVHVRRGDKITREGRQPFQLEDYLEQLQTSEPVLVLTDDTTWLDGFEGTKPRLIVVEPESEGNETRHRLKQRNFFSREETIHLLALWQAATRSERFVGTYTSNMSAFIYLTHNQPDNCVGLDHI